MINTFATFIFVSGLAFLLSVFSNLIINHTINNLLIVRATVAIVSAFALTTDKFAGANKLLAIVLFTLATLSIINTIIENMDKPNGNDILSNFIIEAVNITVGVMLIVAA